LAQLVEPLLLLLGIRLARLRLDAIEDGPIELALELELVHRARRGLDEVQADVELALELADIGGRVARAEPQRPLERAVEPAFGAARMEISHAPRGFRLAPEPREVALRQAHELGARARRQKPRGQQRSGGRQRPVDHRTRSVSARGPVRLSRYRCPSALASTGIRRLRCRYASCFPPSGDVERSAALSRWTEQSKPPERRPQGPGDRKDADKPQMPPRNAWLWFVVILALNFLLVRLFFPAPDEALTVPYTVFKEEVRRGNVESIFSQGERIEGRFV